jgi:NAD(P)H-nitrite reductase large subunit
VFRSIADMRAIRAAAAGARSAVVVGGGLLGLEAARGLRELDVDVTVVHLADRLMELQLDGLAARLLERRIRALGIDVLCGQRTEAVTDEGVVLASGRVLAADLVVFATGIRPEVALARDAGLEVERGVLVDDNLRASAPGVWAVGECAEHRGTVYGLWAPVLEQARAAGAAIAGRPAAFLGAVPATTLKVAGIDLFCAGRAAETDDAAEEVIALDSRRERYRKLVVRDGRLSGATLLGDLSDARELRGLIASGGVVPDALLELGTASPSSEPDHLVCSCQVVSASEIRGAIAEFSLTTVEGVSERTGASTGCGGCRPDVEKLLLTP